MCEPADINEWMTSAPAYDGSDFTDDTPEVQLASRGDTVTAHAGILSAAKAVVKDLQAGCLSDMPKRVSFQLVLEYHMGVSGRCEILLWRRLWVFPPNLLGVLLWAQEKGVHYLFFRLASKG